MSVRYLSESPLGIEEYIFKGSGAESYAPRFTWFVFRKAVISGLRELKPEQLQAEAVNTDVQINSEFSCSNDLFNTINRIWQRSQKDNMHGCIASDCPHRERSPYTGDAQIACATVMLNFDAAAFYQKWIRDMRDAQNPESGYVPNGAPWQPGCGGGVAWGAAMNVIPWEYYLQYGDRQQLEVNYKPMMEQVRHMLNWLTPEGTMFQQMRNPEDGELTPVTASLTGVLRGLIREGFEVRKGMKIADIDPRASQKENCFTISDKARCIGGAVVTYLTGCAARKAVDETD